MRKFFSLLAAIFLIGSVSVQAQKSVNVVGEKWVPIEINDPVRAFEISTGSRWKLGFYVEFSEDALNRVQGVYGNDDLSVYAAWYTDIVEDQQQFCDAENVSFSLTINADGSRHLVATVPDENYCFNLSYDENFTPIDLTNVSYIDADGSIGSVSNPTPITNSSNVLTSGWYIVNQAYVSTGQLDCQGDVKIILVDGANIDVVGNSNQAAVRVTGSNSLTIYGQEHHTGVLTAIGADESAAIGGNRGEEGCHITINGGTIIAMGGWRAACIGGGAYGVNNNGGHDITINGGYVRAVTVAQDGNGIGGGIEKKGYNIWINGGVVEAKGGNSAGFAIGSYDGGPAAEDIYITGSRFVWADELDSKKTDLVTHTSSDDLASTLSKYRYVYITDAIIGSNYATDKAAYFTTYYDADLSYQVTTPDATVYTAAIANEGGETVLSLYELADNIIPVGTAVIIKSASKEVVHMDPYMATVPGVTVPNDLLGTNDGTSVAANSVYTLAAEDGVLAFYKFSGTEIPAHKAYLQLPAGVSAPRRISFGSNVVTGMENINDNSNANVNTNKVLRDGQLLIRKNGHLYNAQGVVVE